MFRQGTVQRRRTQDAHGAFRLAVFGASLVLTTILMAGGAQACARDSVDQASISVQEATSPSANVGNATAAPQAAVVSAAPLIPRSDTGGCCGGPHCDGASGVNCSACSATLSTTIVNIDLAPTAVIGVAFEPTITAPAGPDAVFRPPRITLGRLLDARA